LHLFLQFIIYKYSGLLKFQILIFKSVITSLFYL